MDETAGRPPTHNGLLALVLLTVLFVGVTVVGYVLWVDCLIGCPGRH